MFDRLPFPPPQEAFDPAEEVQRSQPGRLAVIVPTRDRPERLERCLAALADSRGDEFRVYVCDSSGPDLAARVAEICARHPIVELVRHQRIGAAAARNVGTQACRAELVVSVDDDVYVEPGAIAALRAEYERGSGLRVVAGSVDWGKWRSRPLVMRWIGYARDAEPGEEAEFLVSALVLYPRTLGLTCPWNERLWPYDDRFASLLWRAAGATLAFAPDATASHDESHSNYPVSHEADRIYANLFDALFVSRSPRRLLAFELIGFAACAKNWARSPRGAWGLIRAWVRGHTAFLRDLPALRESLRVARQFRGLLCGAARRADSASSDAGPDP